MVITISVNTRKVQNMISGYRRTIPEATARGTYNLARYGAKMLKIHARIAGLKPWGGGAKSIFKDTIAKKLSKNNWIVTMPLHGVWQDRAAPHFVYLKRGRLVTKWAKEHGFKGHGFYFTPKPFIKNAVTKTISKAKNTIEKVINGAIQRKGRS